MGGHSWVRVTTCLFLCSVSPALANQDLAQELGLVTFQDLTKVNVSQDEYTRMMNTYLNALRDSTDSASVPQLRTYEADIRVRHHRKVPVAQLRFPNFFSNISREDMEQLELRLLMPPCNNESPDIKLYQIESVRRRRFLGEHKTYLSSNTSKWCEMDVTDKIASSTKLGYRYFGLELQCLGCGDGSVRPLRASLSILVHEGKDRTKRSASSSRKASERTGCDSETGKQRCCRHTMHVSFKDLSIPLISSIVQPKTYEAGFCKGRCPYNYNHATNHSRIQSLVHRIDRKAVPRVCCAPSKLAPLDILRVDPYDSTKLNVEKWDNMRVLECACS